MCRGTAVHVRLLHAAGREGPAIRAAPDGRRAAHVAPPLSGIALDRPQIWAISISRKEWLPGRRECERQRSASQLRADVPRTNRKRVETISPSIGSC